MAPWRKYSKQASALVLVCFLAVVAVRADEAKPGQLPAVLDKPAPENVEDLKAIQKQVKVVLEKVMPCTVGVKVGASQGSGVIVSKDGYVLTAGHVSGTPNRDITLVFHDGKTVKAKTLGNNRAIDSGLIKITEEGKDWPFVEMAKSGDLKKGQWCIALGQPGGYRAGRTPPLRLGRVLDSTEMLVRTDCTLVGGDSGGPLFDMEGRVIGIHSRIGGSINANIHVPVDTFRNTWDRLAKAEVIGGPAQNTAFLGVGADSEAKNCKIKDVTEGGPAEKAGFKPGDVITKFDGQKIENFNDLSGLIAKKKPNDEVNVEVLRGEETVTLKVKLAKRPTE
ncbi:MAG: S1C family serine protease [Gemmataceae bacterium]|nr:S1C family serine protease [Gemmataceae bacterium]